MLSVLATILPVFALILAGWVARRSGALGAHATSELNRFVVYLALPALLFDVVASADVASLWQPGFIAAFGLGTALVFAVAVALRARGGRSLADAAVDGLNAAYANTGFMGFPLALAVLGTSALAPALVATIVTVCVLFAVALVLIEIALHAGHRPAAMAGRVGGALLRNPLLLAPALGTLLLASGLAMPTPLDATLKLLGAAAPPCALVALGLFLAERRPPVLGQSGTVGLLVLLKLVVHPLLVWLLAVHVFALPAALVDAAVLMAALPTGTGPFMVAGFYQREAGLTARVVLVSTVLSLLTVTAYLGLAR